MKAGKVWAIIIPIIVVLLIIAVFLIKRYAVPNPYPSAEEKAERIEKEEAELRSRMGEEDAATTMRPTLMTSTAGLDPEMPETKNERETESILIKNGDISPEGGIQDVPTPVNDAKGGAYSRRGNIILVR